MKKELLAELKGYLKAVNDHNEKYGVRYDLTASATIEGFATYLETGDVHELKKHDLKKAVSTLEKEQKKAQKQD